MFSVFHFGKESSEKSHYLLLIRKSSTIGAEKWGLRVRGHPRDHPVKEPHLIIEETKSRDGEQYPQWYNLFSDNIRSRIWKVMNLRHHWESAFKKLSELFCLRTLIYELGEITVWYSLEIIWSCRLGTI